MGKLNPRTRTLDSNPSPGADLKGISERYKSDHHGRDYELMDEQHHHSLTAILSVLEQSGIRSEPRT
jgi:hypothetical protein